jgi:hypothetical protein
MKHNGAKWIEESNQNPVSQLLSPLVGSLRFQAFIMAVVVFDCLLVAIDFMNLVPQQEQICDELSNCGSFYILTVLVLFILGMDVFLRMIVMGWSFFKAPLNSFEFLVVVGSIVLLVTRTKFPVGLGRVVRVIVQSSRVAVRGLKSKNQLLKDLPSLKAQEVVNRLVGDILRVGPENVRVNIPAGIFSLKKAEIKKSQFEGLYGPITITAGFLENVKVDVPMKFFGGKQKQQPKPGRKTVAENLLEGTETLLEGSKMEKPAKKEKKDEAMNVTVENVLLVLGKTDMSWEFADTAERKARTIDLILNTFKPLLSKNGGKKGAEKASKGAEKANGGGETPPAGKPVKKRGFLGGVKRLRIDLRNIIIRYEGVDDGKAVAVGVRLGGLLFEKSESGFTIAVNRFSCFADSPSDVRYSELGTLKAYRLCRSQYLKEIFRSALPLDRFSDLNWRTQLFQYVIWPVAIAGNVQDKGPPPPAPSVSWRPVQMIFEVQVGLGNKI